MSQAEVLDWLAARRAEGCGFFTASQIARGVGLRSLDGIRIHEQASTLLRFGVLECRWFGTRRAYRLRKRYLGGVQ